MQKQLHERLRELLCCLMFVSLVPAAVAGDSTPGWVPEGFEPVFAENFSRPDAIEQFVFSSPGDWKRVKDGERYALDQGKGGEGYNPPHRSPTNIGLIRDLQFGSFILDFYVKYTGREYNHQDACVFFNVEDPANYYYVHIGATRDPHAYQIFNVNDQPRTAITRNQEGEKGHDWGARAWHHVRLIRNARKGHIAFYINDMEEPAMVAKDTTHTIGYIGFGSFDDQARFTNIRIWAPDVREQPCTFFQPKQ